MSFLSFLIKPQYDTLPVLLLLAAHEAIKVRYRKLVGGQKLPQGQSSGRQAVKINLVRAVKMYK